MPHRINVLAFVVFATYLAIELGTSGPASATSECLTRLGPEGDQAGHWYYYVDRVRHRHAPDDGHLVMKEAAIET